ncbi:hypothetical protein CSA37_13270 [Candidatus Fermentibacteria bacterium]|nr:MAG: hypothetical protein CSA37_13270 [Candidatus Fermentibacteria bacterium]
MKLKILIDKMIDWGNSIPATPWQMAALFAVTVILRNLMEALQLGIVFTAPAFFLHFPVAYVYPMMVLVFLMSRFSGYDTAKLLKIMVLTWVLTLLPPLIDYITGNTSDIGYFPLTRSNAGWFFLNFFNPAVKLTGTTTGIRIEALLGCVLAGVFTWAVAPDRRWLRGILNTIVFAPVFLSFFTWPYLVAILLQPLFPGDGTTLNLLQWHGATEAPLTGDSHFIVYIIDMIPVSLLSLWYVRELLPNKWNMLRNAFSQLLSLGLAAAAGTAAAIAIPPSSAITFCDFTVIAGALLAALWIAAGSALRGSARSTAVAVGLSLAWSSGWLTLVLALLASAVSLLPGSNRIRRPLTALVLFITALSPAGFNITAGAGLTAVLLIIVITVIACERKTANALFIIPMVVLLLSPPASETPAGLRGLNRRVDSFNRSGRIGLAMESAANLAASGGSWVKLAETAHMAGNNPRSRYLCDTSMARGDSTSSLMKVSINLAFARGDSSAFNDIYLRYVNSVDDPGDLNEAMMLRVNFLALSGDTASLNSLHSRAGMNSALMRSMATALMESGDTLSALQYSLAYLSSPDADAEAWAKAISIASVSGLADWDSLYNEAVECHGRCIPIMLARVRAPLAADSLPDRKELLDMCIQTMPGNPEVLQTAAMWHSEAGNPDSALVYSSRALAGARHPSRLVFDLTISSALEAGNPLEARIASEYAVSEYPDNIRFKAVLAGILEGMDPEANVPSFSDIPQAAAMKDSIAELVCNTAAI